MRSELENLRVSGPRDTFSKRLQIFGDLASRCVRNKMTYRDRRWVYFSRASIRRYGASPSQSPWLTAARRSGVICARPSHEVTLDGVSGAVDAGEVIRTAGASAQPGGVIRSDRARP
jgi:hypothetical protein